MCVWNFYCPNCKRKNESYLFIIEIMPLISKVHQSEKG